MINNNDELREKLYKILDENKINRKYFGIKNPSKRG